ncbi:MAG: hypothetical protein LBQ22_10315 [Bacteroidales bacterium]|jgi:hypothetical protein|nr:hypothetical protein [Bacteroidales bacterium]
MIYRSYIKILIFIIIIFFGSCTEKSKYNSSKKILTSRSWKLNTFVNYHENTLYDIGKTVYDFRDDDVLLRIINNDTLYSKWILFDDSEYLRIDQNTYKITHLNKKTLSLRYGEFEMFFIGNK